MYSDIKMNFHSNVNLQLQIKPDVERQEEIAEAEENGENLADNEQLLEQEINIQVSTVRSKVQITTTISGKVIACCRLRLQTLHL